MRVNKNNLNVAQCFVIFTTLCGDVQKTAAALDLDPAVVDQIAKDEGWHAKIARISLLSQSGKPGEYERGINRALNFTQAHRMRLLLDKLLEEFQDKTPEEILKAVTSRTAQGATSVSARFFSDLTAAMEKTQHLSYLALGDTAGERPDATTEEGEVSANQLHTAVIAALNNPALRGVNVASKLLADEQAQVCQSVPLSQPVTLTPSSEKLPPEGDQKA